MHLQTCQALIGIMRASMQIIGALVVAAGVCLAAAPSDAGASIFQKVPLCCNLRHDSLILLILPSAPLTLYWSACGLVMPVPLGKEATVLEERCCMHPQC